MYKEINYMDICQMHSEDRKYVVLIMMIQITAIVTAMEYNNKIN